MLNAQKRKRDDATLALRMPTPARPNNSNSAPGAMVAVSSTLLQPLESLALEEVLEMVAAGQGGETGMNAAELAALSLRMMNVLREKYEIEKAVATMRMSRMQAAHSSEQRKMADLLKSREEEILVLKRELEAGRSLFATEQQQEASYSSSDSEPLSWPDAILDTGVVKIAYDGIPACDGSLLQLPLAQKVGRENMEKSIED